MNNKTTSIIDRDILRKRFLKYTRKAYHMIPRIEHPHILDIGCGAGIQTLELAQLSKGKVTAIDIDEQELQKLRDRVKENKLQDSIEVKNCSFHDMEFPDESFDIIWAEGIGGFISIKSSMQKWKRFIKSSGFLLLHDNAERVTQYLNAGSEYNYLIIEHFYLPKSVWWEEYYQPLENQLNSLREMRKYSSEILSQIKKYQN